VRGGNRVVVAFPHRGDALRTEALLRKIETSLLEDKFIPHRTAEIVRELLAAVRAEPTLFVFDDVHWLDEASAGLLAHLVRHGSTPGWYSLRGATSTRASSRRRARMSSGCGRRR
jgi:predicted ATPase